MSNSGFAPRTRRLRIDGVPLSDPTVVCARLVSLGIGAYVAEGLARSRIRVDPRRFVGLEGVELERTHELVGLDERLVELDEPSPLRWLGAVELDGIRTERELAGRLAERWARLMKTLRPRLDQARALLPSLRFDPLRGAFVAQEQVEGHLADLALEGDALSAGLVALDGLPAPEALLLALPLDALFRERLVGLVRTRGALEASSTPRAPEPPIVAEPGAATSLASPDDLVLVERNLGSIGLDDGLLFEPPIELGADPMLDPPLQGPLGGGLGPLRPSAPSSPSTPSSPSGPSPRPSPRGRGVSPALRGAGLAAGTARTGAASPSDPLGPASGPGSGASAAASQRPPNRAGGPVAPNSRSAPHRPASNPSARPEQRSDPALRTDALRTDQPGRQTGRIPPAREPLPPETSAAISDVLREALELGGLAQGAWSDRLSPVSPLPPAPERGVGFGPEPSPVPRPGPRGTAGPGAEAQVSAPPPLALPSLAPAVPRRDSAGAMRPFERLGPFDDPFVDHGRILEEPAVVPTLGEDAVELRVDRTERLVVDLPTTLVVGGVRVAARVLNLSADGVFISSQAGVLPAVGKEVELAREGLKPIRARVAHKRATDAQTELAGLALLAAPERASPTSITHVLLAMQDSAMRRLASDLVSRSSMLPILADDPLSVAHALKVFPVSLVLLSPGFGGHDAERVVESLQLDQSGAQVLVLGGKGTQRPGLRLVDPVALGDVLARFAQETAAG